MPGLQDTRRGILQTQINRCTSNVTPSPYSAGYDRMLGLDPTGLNPGAHRTATKLAKPAVRQWLEKERRTMSTNNTAIRAGNAVHNQNNFEIERSSVEFQSCGAILRGIFLTPKGKKEALPVIVMAPGMSGVKEGSIMKYAEYFARGG